MMDIENHYLRACLKALCDARRALLDQSSNDLIQKSDYGKENCLCLDAIPELRILSKLDEFDIHLLLLDPFPVVSKIFVLCIGKLVFVFFPSEPQPSPNQGVAV